MKTSGQQTLCHVVSNFLIGAISTSTWLDTEQFQRHWPTPGDWHHSLGALTSREAAALRIVTRHETALGSDDFVQQLEQTYSVQLRAKSLGLPRKPSTAQSLLPVTQRLSPLDWGNRGKLSKPVSGNFLGAIIEN